MEAATMRLENDADRLVEQAWHMAALNADAKAGKLPNLQTVLNRTHRTRTVRDGIREQRSAWLAFAQHYNIPVKTKVH